MRVRKFVFCYSTTQETMRRVIYCVCFIYCFVEVNCDKILWQPYQFGSGYANREQVVIKNIKADVTFSVSDLVFEWKSVSAGNQLYCVGLMNTSVVIVLYEKNISTGTKITSNVVALGETITHGVFLSHWNPETKRYDFILALATSGLTVDIVWYKLYGITMQKFWTWHFQKPVIHLKHFKMFDDSQFLLIINKLESTSAADIYKFDLNQKQPTFQLFQTLTFLDLAKHVSINHRSDNTYISVFQNAQNSLSVYKLSLGGDGDRSFRLYLNMTATKVMSLASFETHSKSFLAVAAEDSAIYQFTKHGLVKETVENFNFGELQVWFPVPIRNYRDDFMLIAQRDVDYDSHHSHHLDMLLYKEGKFVVEDEAECNLSGEITHGLECIVDDARPGGLRGAAVLWAPKLVEGIVIPHSRRSFLFQIEAVLKKIKSPVQLAIEKLNERRRKIDEAIKLKKIEVQKLIDSFKNRTKSEKTVDDGDDKPEPKLTSGNHLGINPFEEELKKLAKEADVLKMELVELRSKFENTFSTEDNLVMERLVVENDARNGGIEISGEAHFNETTTETINEEKVKTVFEDMVKIDENKTIRSFKTFQNFAANNISYEHSSNESPEDFFSVSQSVTIGNQIISRPVVVLSDIEISGKVNNMNLEDEFIFLNKPYEDLLSFENITVDDTFDVGYINNDSAGNFLVHKLPNITLENLNIFGNVSATYVNKENFTDFVKSLCLTNVETDISEEIVLDGDINLKSLNIKYLNDLQFPEEYVRRNQTTVMITAPKNFTQLIDVKNLNVHGKINEIDVKDVVTLHTPQELSGTFSFNELEIDWLKIEGIIEGPYIDSIKAHPTLLDSNTITSSAVRIKRLTVQGSVIISESLDNSNFENVLNEVIYEDEKSVNVFGRKVFLEHFDVKGGLNLRSEMVNDVLLEKLLTKDTQQELPIEILDGSVTFENLQLRGLYDGINVTKLDNDVVKLDGDQFISSTIYFKNGIDKVDITATEFEVTHALNGVNPDEFVFIKNHSLTLNTSLTLDNVEATNLVVMGGIIGNIQGFSLDDFDANRLSLSEMKPITADYVVRNLNCTSFNSKAMNGQFLPNIFDYENFADQISQQLFEGKLDIRNLVVTGSIDVDSINNVETEELFKNMQIQVAKSNLNVTIFDDDLIIKDLNLVNLNEQNFSSLLEGLVYKNETDIEIDGKKRFSNGFHVKKMIDSVRINNIHVDFVLRKSGGQTLRGPLIVIGNVTLESDCSVANKLKEIPIWDLNNLFSFDVMHNSYTVNTDVTFSELHTVGNFNVGNSIDGKPVNKTLDDIIVIKPDYVEVPGTTTFENIVAVKNNLNVEETINDIDFREKINEEMLFVSRDAVFEGDIMFESLVYVQERLTVYNNLEVGVINEINMTRWRENVLVINKGKIPGTLKFDTVSLQGSVNTKYINDLDIDTLVPLRTDQTIDVNMTFDQLSVFHDLDSVQSVNGLNLTEAYMNSVFLSNDEPYEISSKVTVEGNVMVRGDVELYGPINKKNISRIVTTNTEQILTAFYNFSDVAKFEKGLHVQGNINGMNMSEWRTKSIKRFTKDVQVLANNWRILGNVTFQKDVTGRDDIGSLNVKKLDEQISQFLDKKSGKLNFRGTYEGVCESVNQLLRRAKTQPYLFNYFVELPNLEVNFDSSIKAVYNFKHKNSYYMLVTFENNCKSSLYVWDDLKFNFVNFLFTGIIFQLIEVFDGEILYFVTRNGYYQSKETCVHEGLHVWKFEEEKFELLASIDDCLQLENSEFPRTFYALHHSSVIEYKVYARTETPVQIYQKWKISDGSNFSFVLRDFNKGLAISNGKDLINLIRVATVEENDVDYNTVSYSIGRVEIDSSEFKFGGQNFIDLQTMKVGFKENEKQLIMGIVDDSTFMNESHIIKIYNEDRIFQQIRTYRPSSLISVNFGDNGQSLVTFMEDNRILVVYEYKGIEGYKEKFRINIYGERLIKTKLLFKGELTENVVIEVLHKNKIMFIKAVMIGSHININDQQC